MGGPDTIKGISYQNAYSLYRLIELLDPNSPLESAAPEGKGSDVEDLTLTYRDGWEEAIQIKKREAQEGQFGLWGLGDVSSIIAALFRLTGSGRQIKAYRFVATGSAHPRLIDIQKACQRLREETYTPERDARAVRDIQEMTGAGEQAALDFMQRLWLDVPLESEAFFESAVQNRLVQAFGIPPAAAGQIYNDLYKRLLDRGKQADPQSRLVDRTTLASWLEYPQETTLAAEFQVKIRQRVKLLRGEAVGAEIDGAPQENLDIQQDVDEVTENGRLVGYRRRSSPPAN